MNLKGKVAVVTGASRGSGTEALLCVLPVTGSPVCVNFRKNSEAAKSVVEEIESAGGEAFAIQADVGSVEQLSRFFETLDTELNTRRSRSPIRHPGEQRRCRP